MQASSHTLFEEHQQFRQPWLWSLMGGILVILVVVLGLIIVQGRDEKGSDQAMLGARHRHPD